MNELTEKESSLLLKLQQGIPLEVRPFAVLAKTLEMSEAEVLECVEKFFASGRARRMGGVFDARRLGYRSMLCAVDLPHDAVEKLMPVLVSHPGITHCYERSWPAELPETLEGGPAGREHVPNIWFTLAVNHESFETDIAKLSAALAPYEILQLPALRRFKIDVIFDPGHRKKREEYPGIPRGADSGSEPEEYPLFTGQEKEIVRILDKNMPRVGNPYEVIAAEVGIMRDELLLKLNHWKESGIIRRMAMIVYHHKLGFKANAMCVWHVDESGVDEAGRMLASSPAVTHCYRRPYTEIFPYDLYAMIHDKSWTAVHRLFLDISDKTGLVNGRFLCSTKEFKKTSMSYFIS